MFDKAVNYVVKKNVNPKTQEQNTKNQGASNSSNNKKKIAKGVLTNAITGMILALPSAWHVLARMEERAGFEPVKGVVGTLAQDCNSDAFPLCHLSRTQRTRLLSE